MKCHMGFIGWVAMILLIIGGLNWGFMGLFDHNVLGTLLGSMTVLLRIIYVLVGLSALYGIYWLFKGCGK